MNDKELIAARKAKTHPFGSDCSAKCLEDSLADRLEVLSTPEPDYRAALVIARDAWSRIDRLGNRPEDRVALDRAFDVLAATPEPEPSDEQLQRLDHWLKAQNWADDIDRALSTLQAVNTIFGTSVGVAPVEVTRDELARQFHETYERLAPSFDYSTRIESAVPWDDVPDANKSLMLAVADFLLSRFRVSRRDGEDKNNG